MKQDENASFTNEIIKILSNARGSKFIEIFEIEFVGIDKLISKAFYYAFDSPQPKVKSA